MYDTVTDTLYNEAGIVPYCFTDNELKLIAKLFSQQKVPDGLEKFYHFVTDYSYKTMTIDEAEKFFKT